MPSFIDSPFSHYYQQCHISFQLKCIWLIVLQGLVWSSSFPQKRAKFNISAFLEREPSLTSQLSSRELEGKVFPQIKTETEDTMGLTSPICFSFWLSQLGSATKFNNARGSKGGSPPFGSPSIPTTHPLTLKGGHKGFNEALTSLTCNQKDEWQMSGRLAIE